MPKDWFDGYTFQSMSDDFLVENFSILSERCALSDDWLDEWSGCKQEILNRLRSFRDLEVENEKPYVYLP